MAFTTRCYIRKNTKELRDRLKEIGYKICKCCKDFDDEWLVTIPSEGKVHGCRYRKSEETGIDCGENEELFLAIAALRDDSGAFQWFSDGVHRMKANRVPSRYMVTNCGKMSASELIEMFKEREKFKSYIMTQL